MDPLWTPFGPLKLVFFGFFGRGTWVSGVKVGLSLFGWVPKVCGGVGLARFAVVGIDLFWTPNFGPLDHCSI